MANLRKFWSTNISCLTGTFKPTILHKKPSRSLKKTFDLKNVPMEKLFKHQHNFQDTKYRFNLLVVISFHVCFCRKHFTLANIVCVFCCVCAVIGFAQETYTLREQTAPYTLQVMAVRGFLPQDMVLGVTAIPETACKALPHTQ